jgi:hypothetical protein
VEVETERTDFTPSEAARLIAAIRHRGKDFDPALRRYVTIVWHRARVRERKACLACGVEFEGLVRAKYCSRRCAQRASAKARYWRDPEAARARAREKYLRKKASPSAMGAGAEAG